MVAARAIVRDLFESKENAKIFSTLMLVVAISPILAPTTGGYVTAVFGWRFVFVMLMLIGLIILFGIYFLLPESKKPDPSFSLKPAAIFRNYIDVIRQPQFYTYALTGAISSAGLYAYISGSPFVFMELFGLTEKQYGWIFAIIAIGIISASQFNNLALKNNSSEQIIRVATTCQTMIGLILVVVSLAGWANFMLTTFLVFCFLFCQGFIFPNSSALSLARFAHNAGSASALMGAIQMGIGACTSGLVGVLHNRTMLPMTGVMAFCALSAATIFLLGRKIITQQASLEITEEEDVEMVSTL
jgi:DHA1 family bicyclomycin/chloramphenicol resistance-like MFS transporter